MKKLFILILFLISPSLFAQTEVLSDTMNAYTDKYSRFVITEGNHGKGSPINLFFQVHSTRQDTLYVYRVGGYGKPYQTSLLRQKVYDFRTSETLVDSVLVNKTTYNTSGAIVPGVWNAEFVVHHPYGGGTWYLYRKGEDSLSTHSIWVDIKRDN